MFIAKPSKMVVEDMKALFEEGMQSMIMNYYPPCLQPEKVIGLSPHILLESPCTSQ
ncbi:putative codeine 3-O-demethylase [Helianthus anomalus]